MFERMTYVVHCMYFLETTPFMEQSVLRYDSLGTVNRRPCAFRGQHNASSHDLHGSLTVQQRRQSNLKVTAPLNRTPPSLA